MKGTIKRPWHKGGRAHLCVTWHHDAAPACGKDKTKPGCPPYLSQIQAPGQGILLTVASSKKLLQCHMKIKKKPTNKSSR